MHYGYEAGNNGESGMIYVKGKVAPVLNNKYVDSYEIYMVPGNYTYVTNANFNHSNGHVNGYCIEKEEYNTTFDPDGGSALKVTAYSNDNAIVENDGVFSRLIPEKDLPVKSADGKYSFYVKVNYNNGMEPTFHNLAYLDHTTTSIEDVEAGNAVSIIGRNGEIEIDGSDAVAEVYTTTGVKVYAGTERNIPVAAGIYVVRVAGKTAKVVVR